MVNTLFEYFDSTSAIIFDGKVQYIKPKPLGFDQGGPKGYRRVFTGKRWVKADGARGRAVQKAYKDAVQRWNDGATENWARQQAKTEAARLRADDAKKEFTKQQKLRNEASAQEDAWNQQLSENQRTLERQRKEQARLNDLSDELKTARQGTQASLDQGTITQGEADVLIQAYDSQQAIYDESIRASIGIEEETLEVIKGAETNLQNAVNDHKAAETRMNEAQRAGVEADRDFATEAEQDRLAMGDEVEALPRDRVHDALETIRDVGGRVGSTLGNMIGRRMVQEGVTQTAGMIANTALGHITGVDVGGILQQTIPALVGTAVAGGITTNSGMLVGGGVTLGVGIGLAGYAIGQLNQAQNDIDRQRETQRINRQIWEEENGPMDDVIARAAQRFIDDLEAADADFDLTGADELEVTDEPDSDEQSGKPDDDSPDDPSGSGGPGITGADDKPASKPVSKREPEDHKLPNWFALAFLEWLKNLLEGYKLLIMASFFGGVLVKKFIFSPRKKKKNVRVAN